MIDVLDQVGRKSQLDLNAPQLGGPVNFNYDAIGRTGGGHWKSERSSGLLYCAACEMSRWSPAFRRFFTMIPAKAGTPTSADSSRAV